MIENFNNNFMQSTGMLLLCLMMTAFVVFCSCSSAAASDAESAAGETEGLEPEELYVENQWNYVDGSMDISQGIPADALGRLAKIREKGKLTVATEPYYAPQEFMDPSLSGQDQYVGADMELAKVIAERMGVELEIVPMDFTDVLTAAADGTCDLAISGLAFTPGRASSMELSKGYHYSSDAAGTGILIREKDKKNILSVKDLSDRDIIAQSGSLQEMLMAENVLSYRQFYRVSSMQEIYQALREGKADAAAVDIETTRLYILNNPDCGLRLVDGLSFKLEEQFEGDRIATQKGELQLMYFVNGVIDEILEQDNYSQWFDEYTEYAGKLGL